MSNITIVTMLVFLIAHEGITARHLGVIVECQCRTMENKPIGRYIASVEVSLPTSHCRDTVIIATLKKNGRQVCLDPHAPWVKRVLRKLATQTQ